jgi:hypothetical protein
MMNQDCTTDTDSQMNMLLPMLMMGDESSNSSDDNLMMLMMMQFMGNQPIGLEMILPFLMSEEKNEDSEMLMMVLMNSMTGGMNTQVQKLNFEIQHLIFNSVIMHKF